MKLTFEWVGCREQIAITSVGSTSNPLRAWTEQRGKGRLDMLSLPVWDETLVTSFLGHPPRSSWFISKKAHTHNYIHTHSCTHCSRNDSYGFCCLSLSLSLLPPHNGKTNTLEKIWIWSLHFIRIVISHHVLKIPIAMCMKGVKKNQICDTDCIFKLRQISSCSRADLVVRFIFFQAVGLRAHVEILAHVTDSSDSPSLTRVTQPASLCSLRAGYCIALIIQKLRAKVRHNYVLQESFQVELCKLSRHFV